MRTEITETNIYTFDELSDAAKQIALSSLYDLNVDHDWFDCTYDDALAIDCEIHAFDLDRGSFCNLTCADTETTAMLIIKNHGETCETHKTASQFLHDCCIAVNSTIDGELSDKLEELSDEFIKSLSEDYRIMLSKEYDYLTSDEAIKESIECNEYEFTVDGLLY